MWDKKLHAKMASIDGIYSYVGSFNLDAWSSRNLEVNVTVLDPPLAHQLEDRVLGFFFFFTPSASPSATPLTL